MPEHFLNGTKVGSVFKKMHGEGMTQCVRGELRGNFCFLLIGTDNFPEALTSERLSVQVHEKIFTVLLKEDPGLSVLKICADGVGRQSAERHDAFTAQTATDKTELEIEIGAFERNKLTDTQTGRIEKFEHGFVTKALQEIGRASCRERV